MELAGTVKVPSELIVTPVNPPSFVIEATTSVSAKPAPLRVSLVKTVAVEPPLDTTGAPEKSSFVATSAAKIVSVSVALLFAVLESVAPAGTPIVTVLTASCARAVPGTASTATGIAVPINLARRTFLVREAQFFLEFSMS